jgi:hypothetical protein
MPKSQIIPVYACVHMFFYFADANFHGNNANKDYPNAINAAPIKVSFGKTHY